MNNQPLLIIVLVWSLRAAWIAGTLPILISSIPSKTLNGFHDLLLGFAKRGKTLQSSSKKFSVPQKFFCHFYILAVSWTMFLLVITTLYAYQTSMKERFSCSSVGSQLSGVSHDFSFCRAHLSLKKHKPVIWRSVFLLFLMEAQVLRRLFESLYVFKYSSSARMHILGYLTGIYFYTAAPLSICCTHASDVFKFMENLFAEFVVKGKDRLEFIKFDLWVVVSSLMQLKWYVWIGAAVFSWGWIHQRSCHFILGSLREDDRKNDEYVIPYGDWFEYVSSPHYLAEMVVYGGLVIASGCTDITIWLLFVFVVANLAFSAGETHTWYLRKFDNYPRNRFAIFPFVY